MNAERPAEDNGKQSASGSPEAVLQQQQHLQRILDNTRDAIFQVDLQGNFLFANAAAERLSGYTPEELLCMNMWVLVVQEYHALVQDRMQQREAGAVAESSLEVEIWRKDHCRVWLEMSISSVKDAAERLVAVQGVARDISQRKRAEGALYASKHYLQHIIDNAREIIFQIDLKGNFIFVNATAEKFSGFTPGQLLQMSMLDVVAPDYHALVLGRLRQRIAGNIAESSVEFEIKHKDGHRVWAELTTSGVVDAAEQLVAVQGVVRDITARKRAEMAVQASKHYLQRIIDNTREIIFQIDLKGNFIFANAAAMRLSGYTPEQLVHMTILDVVAADYHPLVLGRLQDRVAGNSAESSVEFKIRHQSGHTVWTELTTSGVVDAEGKLVAVQGVVRDISERKRAELAVAGSQQHLQRIIDNTREVIFQIDLKGNFLFVNATAERLSGYVPAQLLRMNVLEVVAPEYHALVLDRLQQRIAGNVATSSVEFEIRRQDGSRVWAELTTNGMVDAEGRLVSVQGVVRDISERKRAELALRESEERYRLLFFQSPMGIFFFDLQLRLTDCNELLAAMFHTTRGALTGADLTGLQDQRVLPALREALTGKCARYEGAFEATPGAAPFFGQMQFVPMLDARGLVCGGIGMIEDITARKLAEAALVESRERLRANLQAIPRSAHPLRILHVEDEAPMALLTAELIKHALREPYELVTVARLDAALDRLAHHNIDLVLLDLGLPDSQGLDTFQRLHALAPHVAIIIVTGLDDEALALAAMQGGVQDYLVKGAMDHRLLGRAIRSAVARKKAENAFSGERDLLQALIDSLPDHIFIKDVEGHFVRANSALARFLGVANAAALEGKTDTDYFPPGLARQFKEEEERILQSEQPLVNREALVCDQSGQPHWVLTIKVPLRDFAGKTMGTVGINRDVTSLKQAEAELLRTHLELAQSHAELQTALSDLQRAHSDLRTTQMQLIDMEKMRTIGRLAAGVAHEVKNPLSVILRGVSYLAVTLSPPNAVLATVLDDMRDAIARADGVIRGILEFAGPTPMTTKAEPLNGVVEQALLFMKHELQNRHVQVVKALTPDLPLCQLDRPKMSEVFINLIENAVHAMPQGGVLTVRTFLTVVAGLGTNLGEGKADRFQVGDPVLVAEVVDTGTGIPADKLGKIFDPFFTTKPSGQGTGLGLSVSRTIVDLHGGLIELVNNAEGGATARVTLKVWPTA
jgi:PAS domain S-box-containing protein